MTRSWRFAWWRAVGLCFLLAVAALSPASAQAGGQRWALVIGVDRYESGDITPLQFAEADAKAIAGALVQAGGFKRDRVYVLTSRGKGRSRATRPNIVDWLVRLRANVRPQDTFMFIFSGHGMSLDNCGYLVTVDTITDPVENLELSALKMQTLRSLLGKIPAQRMLIAVDACRNDPRAGKGSVDNKLTSAFARDLVLKRKAPTKGDVQVVATLYACKVGERSYEWTEKGQGFFSYFFVQGLRGGARDANGKVTLPSLINYLETKVAAETRLWKGGKAQTPWAEMAGSGAGRWVLASGGTSDDATSSDPAQADVSADTPQPEQLGAMERAQEAFKAGRYGEPEGDNAIELARKALEEDPDNQHARDLESRAAQAYENQAVMAKSRNERDRELAIYRRLMALFPERRQYVEEVATLERPDLTGTYVGHWRGESFDDTFTYTFRSDGSAVMQSTSSTGMGDLSQEMRWRWKQLQPVRILSLTITSSSAAADKVVGREFDVEVSQDGTSIRFPLCTVTKTR